MIAIGQAFGGWGMFAIATAYAAAGLVGARFLLNKNLPTPAGILVAPAAALVPMAHYGLQNGLGVWPIARSYRDYQYFLDWRWAEMEIGTLAAGAFILYRCRLPFAVMPIAVTLWFMSMDFAPLLAGGMDPDWKFRKLVSMVFGIAMLCLAMYVDIRSKRRRAMAFGSTSSEPSPSGEPSRSRI